MPNHTFNSCPQNRVQQFHCHVAVHNMLLQHDNAKRFIDWLIGLICQIAQPKSSFEDATNRTVELSFATQIRNMSQVCSPSCGWCSGGNLPFSAVDLLIEAGDCCGFAVRSLAPHNHVTTNVWKWHSVLLWQSCLQLVLLSRVGMKSNTLTLKTKERSRVHCLFWSTV